jgi:hypothetical protein
MSTSAAWSGLRMVEFVMEGDDGVIIGASVSVRQVAGTTSPRPEGYRPGSFKYDGVPGEATEKPKRA